MIIKKSYTFLASKTRNIMYNKHDPEVVTVKYIISEKEECKEAVRSCATDFLIKWIIENEIVCV